MIYQYVLYKYLQILYNRRTPADTMLFCSTMQYHVMSMHGMHPLVEEPSVKRSFRRPRSDLCDISQHVSRRPTRPDYISSDARATTQLQDI